MDAQENISDQQSLCLSCGLCCNGTVFGRVPLKPEDVLPPLEAAGIVIEIKKEANKSFRLPCVAHQKNCCQVYHDRPTSCRGYRCVLLKKYENGDISWEESQQKIDQAKELKAIIDAEMQKITPGGERMSIAELLKATPQHPELVADPPLLKKWATALLCLSALQEHLRTHFQPPRKKETQESAK